MEIFGRDLGSSVERYMSRWIYTYLAGDPKIL